MALDYCPNCGAEVPSGARACPECGSDEETGWSDTAHADRLGLPDEHFDHEAFVAEEFDDRPRAPRRQRFTRWVWGGMVIVIILWYLLR